MARHGNEKRFYHGRTLRVVDSEGVVVRNGETLEIEGAKVENSTGTGIALRRLADGTIEITRCCIRVPRGDT